MPAAAASPPPPVAQQTVRILAASRNALAGEVLSTSTQLSAACHQASWHVYCILACGRAAPALGTAAPSLRNEARNMYIYILSLTASPLSSGAALVAFGLAGPSSPPSPWYRVVPRTNLKVGGKLSGPSLQSSKARPAHEPHWFSWLFVHSLQPIAFGGYADRHLLHLLTCHHLPAV